MYLKNNQDEKNAEIASRRRNVRLLRAAFFLVLCYLSWNRIKEDLGIVSGPSRSSIKSPDSPPISSLSSEQVWAELVMLLKDADDVRKAVRVSELLSIGIDPNREIKIGGPTLFMYALSSKAPKEIVKKMIDLGGRVEGRDKDDDSFSVYVAEHIDNYEVFQELKGLGLPCTGNARRDRMTPLHVAAKFNGSIQVIKGFAEMCDKASVDREGETALFKALSNKTERRVEIIRALAEAGVPLDIKNIWKNNLLIESVSDGKEAKEEIVKLLIDLGVPINVTDNRGNTALMRAIDKRASLSVVKTLVTAGIPIDIKDEDGQTALMKAAADCGNPGAEAVCSIFHELLAARADVNKVDKRRETALSIAIWNGASIEQVIEPLIAAGADMGPPHRHLSVALSRPDHPETVLYLLEKGVDPNYPKDDPPLFFSMAGRHPNPDIIKALLKAGANLESRNKKGDTPLLYALKHSVLEKIIVVLIDAGADVSVKDSAGAGVLEAARKINASKELIDLLIAKGAVDIVPSK